MTKAERDELLASIKDGAVRSSVMSLVGKNGELDLYDGTLRARDADGAIIFEGLDAQLYRSQLKENPCLSCATHALGQMPLSVEIVDTNGACVDRLMRNGGRR